MKTGYTHRCGKVLGGIGSVLLTEKSNLRKPSLDPVTDTYNAVGFSDPRKTALCTFAEGAGSYREELQAEVGIVCVDHILEFSTDRLDDESNALVRSLIDASPGGVVALVTTRNGVQLLVGYSEENRDERPLRLTRSAASSGRKPTDAAGETVVLRSKDCAKARIVNPNHHE
jgi:hypothetical protein